MFLLQCPKCGNKMKYMPTDNKLLGKKKRCVYCGHTFGVQKQIRKFG